MSPTNKARPGSIYELKVTLADNILPVWLTVQVPSAFTLHQLHTVIQAAMGWEDYHLYQFEIGDRKYAKPDEYEVLSFKDALRALLGREVQAGDTFIYEYDFGDSWFHDIVVEQELSPEPDMRYPVCIKGEGACPPEDCGGIFAYKELLENLSDPTREQHSEAVSWVDEGFDPRVFDLAAANRRLGSVK